MSGQIKDGAGKGFSAQVDDELRLRTFAVTLPLDKHVNVTEGKTWSLYFEETPTGAGDYFFYFRNNGDATLAMTDFRSMCTSTETIIIEQSVGVPVYVVGTSVPTATRNTDSSKTPVATIKHDANITGLVSGGVIFYQRIDTANKMNKLSTTSNIIIPQGGEVAFKATTGTALITMLVSLTVLD